MYEDKEGVIWLGTANGLIKFKYSEGKGINFKTYYFNKDKSRTNIFSICCDTNKIFWIGTFGEGLYILNPLTEQFINYQNDAEDLGRLIGNFITYSIIEDRSGNVWIGTSSGISMHSKIKFNFYSFNQSVAYTFFEDDRMNLWITGSNDFHIRDTNGVFKIIPFKFPDKLKFVPAEHHAGVCDKSGVVWLGYRNSLFRFDRETGKFK